MKQWLAVTNDRYELPVYSTDSPEELGNKLGLTKKQVVDKICKTKYYKHTRGKYKLIRVDIGDPYQIEWGDFKID